MKNLSKNHSKNLILIVDDNIENLNVLSDILENHGCEVLFATNGQDALKTISISPPELILLDVNMPGMSGYEVCAELKKNETTKDIPVIFLSALTEITDMVRGFESGALDYITKPFSPEIIFARVKTHIELYKIKQNLERIVTERTTELRLVNEELMSTADTLKENLVELAKAKESSEENAKLLQNVTDNIPAFVAVVDANTLKYKFANKKYVLGFNKKIEDIINNDLYNVIGESNYQFALKYIEEVKKGNISSYINTFNLVEGKRHVHVNFVPGFNEAGEVKDILVLSYDITDIKNVEEELLKSKEKAEESDQLKTAFLQNMSHEIRTPMNAIIGFSRMLEKPELSEDKRKSFTSIIINSSNQLLSIVTDILTISSLETKQEKLNIQKICINNIIVDLLAIFKTQAFNRNVDIYAKQQLSDQESEIYTDGTKITQVLTNLIGNSLKFTHVGFIEFGYEIVDTAGQAYLQFHVKDTGIGINPDQKEEIFERFRQADLSINKKYGGTGLGLSISKGFVEMLGGKIWVESKPKEGSTFYFTIPYRAANKTNTTTQLHIKNAGEQMTILVAEDEEYNYLFIEELLNEMGIKSIHAKNGIETIELCKSNSHIDLILMDIKMPMLDGFSAALKIKEFRPDLPIIAQSAYALEHEMERYSGPAFDDYITKPIKESEFKQKLMKFIKS